MTDKKTRKIRKAWKIARGYAIKLLRKTSKERYIALQLKMSKATNRAFIMDAWPYKQIKWTGK